MPDASFFNESRQQSQVKSSIVSKYFMAWATVMISVQNRYRRSKDPKIAYIDLFAGPGRYSDGTTSTPILVLEKAISDSTMSQRLVTIFNDKDSKKTQSLSEAINQLPGIERIKHKPKIYNSEVGDRIVNMFENMSLVPTLFFVDPWGYKGLSLRLVNSVLKDWGCDCIIFFNYNRINMGLSNELVQGHMDALFGKSRADNLRKVLEPLIPAQRELTVVGELCNALNELGATHVLPFCFKDDHGSRTSHHLIFASKNFKGYEIMKEIMAKESTAAEQGVATFEYNPVDANMAVKQGLLFSLSRPLDDLGNMLLDHFAGQELPMKNIYELHNINRPYIKKNYKDVLIQLESTKKITTSPHRANSFADSVIVTFPPK